MSCPEMNDLVAMLECQAFALEDILEQKKKLADKPKMESSPPGSHLGFNVKVNVSSKHNDTKLYHLTNSSLEDSIYP